MARAGRPVTKRRITDAGRIELKARLRVRKAPADEKPRIRIVPAGCAEGRSGTVITQRLQATLQAAGQWRRHCAAYRLAGPSDAPRAGCPRTVDDAHVQASGDKLYKAGVIHRQSGRHREAVELLPLDRVHRFNHQRPPAPTGCIRPAEAEAACYRHQAMGCKAAYMRPQARGGGRAWRADGTRGRAVYFERIGP